MSARERLRTFLACGVDVAAAGELYDALQPSRTELSDPVFRWIDPANYHVTLRFFGDLTRAEIAMAGRLIEPIAAARAPIDCRAAAPHPLPNARRPTVLALPLVSDGALERLAAGANAAFEPVFGPPDKPFKAHLTVVRCRRGARFAAPPIAFDRTLRFDRVALFESSQAHSGVRYSILEEFALSARSAD